LQTSIAIVGGDAPRFETKKGRERGPFGIKSLMLEQRLEEQLS